MILRVGRSPVSTIVPAFDLSQQFQAIGDALNQATLKVLASGRYIGGETIETFEKQFAEAMGSDYGIACNSGTDALYLALRALGIGPGDRVITPSFTFIATAETVSMAGATPAFVDIDPVTFNLDLQKLEAAITPDTKAIIPVHLFGQAADMTAVMEIAKRHNLYVIEDCAQATQAQWQGRTAGSIGDIGCFSFYPTKNLGACGDGGAMTTNHPELATKLRALRDHGRTDTYYHELIGMNSRLDGIQAAILTTKLPHLPEWNKQRNAIADRYQAELADLPGIKLPKGSPGCVWNQYTIRVLAGGRDRLREQLRDLGVMTAVYYPIPIHLQPVYEPLGYGVGTFPESERAALEVLSLPMFPELSVAQQDIVISALKKILS
jgi:dTDP-4-amino-4,6-dideoxygalactose transaminase